MGEMEANDSSNNIAVTEDHVTKGGATPGGNSEHELTQEKNIHTETSIATNGAQEIQGSKPTSAKTHSAKSKKSISRNSVNINNTSSPQDIGDDAGTASQLNSESLQSGKTSSRKNVTKTMPSHTSPLGDLLHTSSAVGNGRDSNRSSAKSLTLFKSHSNVERNVHHPHSKEKIRTDVFLTDYTVPRMNSNLLANSLQARLRKTIPFDLRDNKDAIHKIKRDSMKDMIQLAVLDKQFNAEMQRQKTALKSQENQLRRRQQVMRRRTELNKMSNDRIQAQIRARTEPIIVLPRLTHSGTTSAPVDCESEEDSDIVAHELTAFSPVHNEKPEETSNLEYSIRMVRMCQSPGAFLSEVNEILSRKKSKRKPEEIEMLTDDSSTITSSSRHKKATRTLSEYSRKDSISGTTIAFDDRHSFSAPPTIPAIPRTNKQSRRPSQQGATVAGVGWHIPTTEQSTHQKNRRLRNISNFKKVSKDLHPVTTLMNRFGISERQTASHVPEVGELPPTVVLPRDVSKYHSPIEMANHVANFLKKYPVKKKLTSINTQNDNNNVKSDDDHPNSGGDSSSCKTDQGYSVGTGMSTNRSVTSQNID